MMQWPCTFYRCPKRFRQQNSDKKNARHAKPLLIVPLIVSLSFMLVADIDSPRGGVIRVRPLNLHALADSFRSH